MLSLHFHLGQVKQRARAKIGFNKGIAPIQTHTTDSEPTTRPHALWKRSNMQNDMECSPSLLFSAWRDKVLLCDAQGRSWNLVSRKIGWRVKGGICRWHLGATIQYEILPQGWLPIRLRWEYSTRHCNESQIGLNYWGLFIPLHWITITECTSSSEEEK